MYFINVTVQKARGKNSNSVLFLKSMQIAKNYDGKIEIVSSEIFFDDLMSLVLDFLIIVCVDSSHSFPFEFILQVF
jgi:hypothetical protein